MSGGRGPQTFLLAGDRRWRDKRGGREVGHSGVEKEVEKVGRLQVDSRGERAREDQAKERDGMGVKGGVKRPGEERRGGEGAGGGVMGQVDSSGVGE